MKQQLLLAMLMLGFMAPDALADVKSDALAEFRKNVLAGVTSDFPPSVSYAIANVKIAKQALPEKLPTAYHNLALCYAERKDYANAATNQSLKIDCLKKAVPPDYQELCESYNSLGFFFSNLKRNDECVAAYQQAISASEKLPPVKPTEMSWVKRSLNNLADALRKQNRAAEAEKYAARAKTLTGTDPQ